MAKILVVEDDVMLNDLVRRNLALVGHTCQGAVDGNEALSCLDQQSYDLMILDIMLPELDGFGVMAQVKDQPTIFLTAKDGLSDRLTGFSLGADDYLTKPFEMLELLARVEVVLRHTKRQEDLFSLGDVRIHFESRQAYHGNTLLDLTPKEFELLDALVRNRNIALSRDRLLDMVWGYDFEGDTRTVDVHITKLRKKLGWEDRIRTVYKLGYRLEVDS